VAEARLEYLQRRLDFGKGKGAPKKRQEVLWQEVVDRFSAEHLKTVRASSAATYRGALGHAREAFRDRPLRTLRYGDLWALHEAMSSTPRQANVALRLVGMIFDRAIAWDLWDPQEQGLTPSERLKRSAWKPYKEEPRNRPLSDDELDRLGAALAELEPKAVMQVAAVRLLLFTGKRLREILDLRWGQVDISTRTIHWEETKTGPMTAPLNDAALEVLQGLPRLILKSAGGEEVECPLVLPTTTGKPIRDLSKFWARLLNLAKIEDAHRHDLRHTHGHEAAGLGLNLQTTAALLGHRDAHTSERYSKVEASAHPALEASQPVASSLARKMGGE
jgi:integrase